MRALRLPWIVLAMLVAAPGARAAEDPSCGAMPVAMRLDAVVYRLPHGFIRPGTDRAHVRGEVWRNGVDYALDPLRGELRLLRESIPGDTLWVEACWLLTPPPLELWRARYRPPTTSGTPEAPPDTAPPVPPRPGVSRDRLTETSGMSFAVTGSKSVSVDFGSQQDAFLHQSLDLSLSGSLAPGVELTGVLSDRNTPLTESGSTQDLQALDRVLLELKTPSAAAQLGDVDVSLEQGEFARVRRRLQGVSASVGSGGSQARFAAATAPGEFRRMEIYGTEGFQGPYVLTDAQGSSVGTIVPGSEIVTLEGVRLQRGESADYSIDYDTGRLTFTSRRPIAAGSRIAIEFQASSTDYHRRLLMTGGRWERPLGFVHASLLSESDDRGRPVNGALDAQSLATLALVGDSARYAYVPEVSDRGGDYDTVRVDSSRIAYSYVGKGAGRFSVAFALVGPGRGDYEAYPVTSGVAYRFVGSGRGTYSVGKLLPLPQSHQLASAGAGAHAGPLSAEVEGAVSRLDRNTFSSLDDGDNMGGAGRARVALEGAPRRVGLTRLGLSTTWRQVEQRFAPFGTLSPSFEAERWGLRPGSDLDHRRELGVEGTAAGRTLGSVNAAWGRLVTPAGFEAERREAGLDRSGLFATRVAYLWARGRDPSALEPDGSRERIEGALSLRGGWLVPSMRVESDSRLSPGDSLRVGARVRSAGAELATGPKLAWKLLVGVERRRDALPGATGFVDQGETRVLSTSVRTPERPGFEAEVRYQRRRLEPLAAPVRTRGDLGALRMRSEDRHRGLSGRLDLEVTGDGEAVRERRVVYAGPGQGAYDALGNYVGTGDYTVTLVVTPQFERVSRATTSAQVGWDIVPTAAWQGTRSQFEFDSETRRRGDLEPWDPWVSPGVVMTDPDLVRATLRQRLESEWLPGSRVAALRLTLERQLSADRSFQNFQQTLDSKTATLRWRARPASATTTEFEGHWRRQSATQLLVGSAGLARTLVESGATAQLVLTPDARLRAAGVAEITWSKPIDAAEATRTLRVGPDLGLALGPRGHAELSVRRGFVHGAPPVSLLPSSDPPGPPLWESSGRLDYRVHVSTTLGMAVNAVERTGRATKVTGRAEARIFF